MRNCLLHWFLLLLFAFLLLALVLFLFFIHYHKQCILIIWLQAVGGQKSRIVRGGCVREGGWWPNGRQVAPGITLCGERRVWTHWSVVAAFICRFAAVAATAVVVATKFFAFVVVIATVTITIRALLRIAQRYLGHLPLAANFIAGLTHTYSLPLSFTHTQSYLAHLIYCHRGNLFFAKLFYAAFALRRLLSLLLLLLLFLLVLLCCSLAIPRPHKVSPNENAKQWNQTFPMPTTNTTIKCVHRKLLFIATKCNNNKQCNVLQTDCVPLISPENIQRIFA